MDKRTFKDKAYGELARITNALSNPRRLEIIDLLAQGEKSVEMISVETSLSVANASQHLQVLKSALLVETRREGNFVFYRIASDRISQLWELLKSLGFERIAEIERLVNDFRRQKNSLQSYTIPQLIKRMEKDNILLIDVRPESEYKNGHIQGALSMPIDQLERRLKELPKTKQIVVYCRGPFCVFADDAVALLTSKKYKAVRLDEGFPVWKGKGLAIATHH